MPEFTSSKVRELKGAPLSCLVLLALNVTSVTQEWLERNSNYTDKPVSQALAYLVEQGWVSKSRLKDGRSGFRLAEGFQLPLGALLPESRNYSDSTVVVLDLESESSVDLVKDINNNNNKSRKYSDSIVAILAQAGIRMNDRVQDMLALEHVTESYLQAKIEEYRALGKGGARWPGMLIKAVERGEPAPVVERNPNGHLSTCECVKCQVGSFTKNWEE